MKLQSLCWFAIHEKNPGRPMWLIYLYVQTIITHLHDQVSHVTIKRWLNVGRSCHCGYIHVGCFNGCTANNSIHVYADDKEVEKRLRTTEKMTQLQTQLTCNVFRVKCNPFNAEIFLHKPRRPKGCFQFEIIITGLVSSYCFNWIPMLRVYGNYTFSMLGPTLHVRIWRPWTSDCDV